MATPPHPPETRQLIEHLCNLQVPNDIQVSPTANNILYATSLSYDHKKGKHVVSTLWLADTGKQDCSRQLTSGNTRDYHPRWHPQEDCIAFISDRARPGEQWAIYLWQFSQGLPFGEPHPITDTENERPIVAFEFSPDGRRLAFLCADPKTAEDKAREAHGEDWKVWGQEWVNVRLRTVDLETKAVVRHAGKDHSSKSFDDHATALCWRDSQSLAVVHTRTSHIEEPFLSGSKVSLVKIGPVDTPDMAQMWSIEEFLAIPSAIPSIAWADETLYFIGGAPIDKTCGGRLVYAASTSSGGPKRVAFGQVNDAKKVISVNGQAIAYVEHGLRDEIWMLPNTLLLSLPQRIDALHVGRSMAGDGLTLAISTSDINTPAEVYSLTASPDSAPVRLSNHGAVFRNRQFGSCHFFKCASRDHEVDLDGIFLTPSPRLAAESQPTVVLIHGGPTARDTNAFDSYLFYWTPFLLHHGYSVVLTNYRGSSGRGEAFASYSLRGVGKWDHEDVVTITDHAVKLGFADQDRLMVGGISQGGFLSYLCSTRNGSLFPWKFNAAVPLNGVTETDTLALASDLGSSLETELSAGGPPWTMPSTFTGNRQASAIWEVSAAVQSARKDQTMIIPPMLIMQSEDDERCPIAQGVGMRRALAHHGLPYEFVAYPRQNHMLHEQKFWIDMAERLLRWCDTYIGVSTAWRG